MEHVHLPQRDDPDHCAYDSCGLIWSDPVHAPSVALRKLSEAPPDLRPLAQHERASGAPFVPPQRDAAPATHTGRPAHHPGTIGDRWIMCPMRSAVPGSARQQCPFSSPMKQEVGDHLARAHGYGEQAVGFYLAHPWFANEDRKAWVARTAHLRGVHNIASKVQETDANDDYCDHPNGFGPNGCPCGSSAPDEDAEPTFRNLTTNVEERAIRCPSCSDAFPESRILRHLQSDHLEEWPISKTMEWCAEHGVPTPSVNVVGDGSPLWGHQVECPVCANAYIKGNIRRHLQTVHQWTGDMWDDWAESVNFMEHDLVPKELLDFMNADITMEQIMTDAATPGDPHADMRAELTDWWVELATQEADKVVPKAVEYGALDLIQIGQDLALCAGREVTDEEAAEMGVYFYLRGKLARWTDAVITGRRVSDDTLHDIGVYVRMAQRIRAKGSWPGV